MPHGIVHIVGSTVHGLGLDFLPLLGVTIMVRGGDDRPLGLVVQLSLSASTAPLDLALAMAKWCMGWDCGRMTYLAVGVAPRILAELTDGQALAAWTLAAKVRSRSTSVASA